MRGLKLFTGNRLETLVDRLAEVLRQPPAPPLEKEILIVQSRGMERWVSMELARRHRVCANVAFPFPNAFIHEMFRKVVGEVSDPSPYDPSIMTWRIMKLLPSCIAQPEFQALHNYLRDDPHQLKRFQLSRRIAGLFDQYLIYRPDMVLQWEKGEQDHWQSILWRELSRGNESTHSPALKEAFHARIRDTSVNIEGLPQRIAVFGISSLPPFHMEVFAELSRLMQVNLFLMNPCREYWADIKSDREIARITGKASRKDLTPQELYLEKGNSLLASMGTLGREFFHLVRHIVDEEEDLSHDPAEKNLLHCIQSDILNLTERDPAHKTQIHENDHSIVIHSCHSPMREIEVLYDHLLALFDQHPKLSPKDILVMAPDIDAYAPYIQAVFDAPEDPEMRIPFSITDRSIRKESHIIDTFLALVNLSGSRFSAPQVLALLESSALRRKFDLSLVDLDLIRRWVNETRIRWGVDGENRARLGFDPFPENSWRAGLDRLMLGFAMPGDGERMFHSILPYDHMEGSETTALGKLMDFTHRLFSEVDRLAHPRTLVQWTETLAGLLDKFFDPDPESEREAQTIRLTLSDLSLKAELSGFDEPVPLEVIKAFLCHRLETESMGLGFITGGVTFCAMLPMRSIPFEVICLVGMDDGAFPRQTRSLGFDLMARAPRPGDRSQRDDDRYLFLEALLSARRQLSISYVGQSAEDNSSIPPSVLVSELRDVIELGFEAPSRSILDHITTRHRLQPFSPQYYQDRTGRNFSYSRENCHAAIQCRRERAEPAPFISSSITEPEKEWRTVNVDLLCRFFGHPTKFLLTQRLRMQLQSRDIVLEDREAFRLDSLERYLLQEELLDKSLAPRETRDFLPVMRASGRLPHGVVGDCAYDTLIREVRGFFKRIEPFQRAAVLPSREVDLVIDPFRVTGSMGRITELGLVHYRAAKVKSKDRLNIWIRHLVRNVLEEEGQSLSSFLIGSDDVLEYHPVGNAQALLGSLLRLYWKGLQAPLPFFPQSSYAYARSILDGKTEDLALKAAQKEWEGDMYRTGEAADDHLALCFQSPNALDDPFPQLAMEVFQPLLACQKELG